MKRICSIFLASIMFCLVGCGGDKIVGVTDLVVKSELEADVKIGGVYTLIVDYPSDYGFGITVGNKKIATWAQGKNSKEYIFTGVSAGEYIIKLKKGDEVKRVITLHIYSDFPSDPNFNPLGTRTSDFTSWKEFGAHDPSFIEVNENGKSVYYAFSTDVSGTKSGYQIRKSTDLTHWSYEQTAISADDLLSRDYLAGNGNYQEAFDWAKTTQEEAGNNAIVTSTAGTLSFWAPDIVKGNDGKYWLYFSLTGFFGGSRSCIGLAKSENILGPYKYDSLIVKSQKGWATPNAIDGQVIFEENDSGKDMWLVYGSFGKGIHMIELDGATGRRKDKTAYKDSYALVDGVDEYYGKCIATGGMEGPVITYNKDINVFNNETKAYEKKSYYTLFTSYGDLTSSYHMRSARSETINGEYKDISGVSQKSTANDWTKSTGNKVMGSFKWDGDAVDYSAPGHNDLTTLDNGVNLVVYHCRTYYFDTTGAGSGNNYHYIYLSQYAYNDLGQLVINPNRYANEKLRKIEKEELTTADLTGGKYNLIVMDSETTQKQSVKVTLKADGSITGAKTGAWTLSGDNYLNINIGDEEFHGVVMPTWITGEKKAGLAITALSQKNGFAMYLNSDFN